MRRHPGIVHVMHADENDSMIQCLICLVCWPMLCCYQPDEDIDHYCAVCKARLTHKPHGGPVAVVASQQLEPPRVYSQFQS